MRLLGQPRDQFAIGRDHAVARFSAAERAPESTRNVWATLLSSGRRSGTLSPMSPRKRWLDGRIDVFMSETNRLGPTCPRGPIGEEIRARVNAVALTLRVSEAPARREFDDEMIREMARTMAAEVADEAPGSDPMTMPPTQIVFTALAGRTSAGLAIVAELAMTADLTCLDDDTFERVDQALAMIVSWGSSSRAPRLCDLAW